VLEAMAGLNTMTSPVPSLLLCIDSRAVDVYSGNNYISVGVETLSGEVETQIT